MALTFKQALDKSLIKNPGWGMYIHLCDILQESGASRTECLKHFNKYMPADEYDKTEKGEMVDYLALIAQPEPLK